MHILVLISAAVTIILVILSKFYSLSIIYPSLMLILTIMLDLLSNTLQTRKDKKLEKKIEEIKNK